MPELSTQEKEAARKRLDEIEMKAWDHIRHHRLFEGFGLIELWHLVHRESGLKRNNPFSDMAALARQKYRALIEKGVGDGAKD